MWSAVSLAQMASDMTVNMMKLGAFKMYLVHAILLIVCRMLC